MQATKVRGSSFVKMEKPRNLVSLPKNQRKRKSEQFQLLIFGNSITKKIRPSVIIHCDEIQAVYYSTGGSNVRGVYEQHWAFKKDHGDASVKSIIIHVGTNCLPPESPVEMANKICRLMIHTSKEFSNILTYFLAILTKFGRSLNSIIS